MTGIPIAISAGLDYSAKDTGSQSPGRQAANVSETPSGQIGIHRIHEETKVEELHETQSKNKEHGIVRNVSGH